MSNVPQGKNQNIIWDWNGTLLDDAESTAAIVNEILSQYGKAPLSLAEQRAYYRIPIRLTYERLGFSEIEFHEAGKIFHQKHSEALPNISLRSSVVETLQELSRVPLRQFVLSSYTKHDLEGGLTEKKIRQFFEAVYGLPKELTGQSKAAIGNNLLRERNLDPSETLIVGDSIHDYEVADELSLQCVLLCGGHDCESKLRETSAPVVREVSELLSLFKPTLI